MEKVNCGNPGVTLASLPRLVLPHLPQGQGPVTEISAEATNSLACDTPTFPSPHVHSLLFSTACFPSGLYLCVSRVSLRSVLSVPPVHSLIVLCFSSLFSARYAGQFLCPSLPSICLSRRVLISCFSVHFDVVRFYSLPFARPFSFVSCILQVPFSHLSTFLLRFPFSHLIISSTSLTHRIHFSETALPLDPLLLLVFPYSRSCYTLHLTPLGIV